MKLIIDSNILLDVLYAREPHSEKSLSVWRLCEAGKLRGFVSVLTFANIVYIMRKELDEEKIKDCWEKFSKRTLNAEKPQTSTVWGKVLCSFYYGPYAWVRIKYANTC